MISIVANFYKSEAFIPNLIKSVQNQSFQDWELICVNDASPLNDAKIIRKYAASDARIRLIDLEENVGISKAKAIGISNANGEFITFIDGDDWLDHLAIEKLYEPVLQHPELDIVLMNAWRSLRICGVEYKKPFNNSPKHPFGLPIDMNKDRWTYLRHFYGQSMYNSAYWGKLYRRQLIIDADFKPRDNPIGEDYMFNFEMMRRAKSICFIDYPGYFWRWGGITSGINNKCQLSVNQKKFLKASDEYFLYLNKFIPVASEYDDIRVSHLEELVQNIFHVFSSIASFSPFSVQAESLKKELATLLANDKSYGYLKNLEQLKPDAFTTAVVQAIIHKDANALYSLAHTQYKSNWKKYILKKLAHRLLSILQLKLV